MQVACEKARSLMQKTLIEKEAIELKHKSFITPLHLIGMHGKEAEEQAHLPSDLFALENSASVRCACTWVKSNLDNCTSVIYDMWSLEIWRNNMTCEIIKRTPRHDLEIGSR